jgi:nicotinamide-nucleotide amidase
MNKIKASIVTIGDELLIGQIIDNNSAWLADKLFHAGLTVQEIRSISDDPEQLEATLSELIAKNEVLILTGGLGPTSDDKTVETLNRFFGGELITNEDVLADIKSFVEKRRGFVNLTPNNRAQALVSTKAKVLRNPIGTAPSQVFEQNNCIVISLPGVPFEMKKIFEDLVLPLLNQQFELQASSYETLHVIGYAESELSTILAPWEAKMAPTMKIAYLPSPGIIRLRLSEDYQNTEILQLHLAELRQILGKNIVGSGKERVEYALSKILISNNLTIATAESCTGGSIGSRITSIAGASEIFKGGITAYSNEAKIALLKVESEDIAQYGAVSKQVACAMAKGAAQVLNTDIAVSTTGIAGPGGGTPEKPVGTVWIGVYVNGEVEAKKYKFTHSRQVNIERTATIAMYEVLRKLL